MSGYAKQSDQTPTLVERLRMQTLREDVPIGVGKLLTDAADRIKELERVVEKLPVTKDGKRVVPFRDPVYLADSQTVLASEHIVTRDGDWVAYFGSGLIPYHVEHCFSTAEAAKKITDG